MTETKSNAPGCTSEALEQYKVALRDEWAAKHALDAAITASENANAVWVSATNRHERAKHAVLVAGSRVASLLAIDAGCYGPPPVEGTVTP